MELELLKELNLTNLEAKTYLALLKTGTNLASKIADETRINRSLTYQILGSLIQKGLVSYAIRENRRYYSAVNPEKLLDLIKEKEEKLKEAMPRLLEIFNPSEKPLVETLEGIEGIKTILKDILKVGQEWFGFGSSGLGPEILSYYTEHWEKERQKQKILLKAILVNSPTGIKRGSEFKKMKYTEVKYMQEEYSSPASTWIYGDRLVFVMWDKEHPFAIRIVNKKIVESYKNHFAQLWKQAKP